MFLFLNSQIKVLQAEHEDQRAKYEMEHAFKERIQPFHKYLAKSAQEQVPTNAVHGTEPYESHVQFGQSGKSHHSKLFHPI